MGRSEDGPGVTVVATHDLDQAHEYIDKVFTPHRLVLRETAALGFDLRYAESPRLTVGHLTYGAQVTVDVPPTEDCYHMTLPVRGFCEVSQRREWAKVRVGKSAALLSPDEPLLVRWEPDSVEYIVKVSKASLEAHLARLAGRPLDRPVRFALGFDLDTGGGQALAASIPFIWAELAREGGISTMPLAREHLEYAVLTQMLMVIPHNYSDVLADSGQPPRRRRLQDVLDFIDAHPEQTLTTPHLAELAGVTDRALQLAFQKEVGTSPAAYVRGVRLDRVHAELSSAAGHATVTEVAARWGFLHPSRFAQQYRERFGTLPSETSARARQ
jgi:AraC-like DNA-binding protein